MMKSTIYLTGLITTAIALIPTLSRSQTINPELPPLEVNLFQPENAKKRPDVITANTPYLANHKIPSLWWTTEQQITNKLVRNWLIYPKQKRIDLLINSQLWSILDYVERYKVVSQYGQVSQGYGYNLRIFNPQQNLLGAYYCQGGSNCNIWFNALNNNNNINLRGQENKFNRSID